MIKLQDIPNYIELRLSDDEIEVLCNLANAIQKEKYNLWIVPGGSAGFKVCLVCNQLFEYTENNHFIELMKHGKDHVEKYKAFL